ncbi:MAG: hypothetical protein JWM16_4202 [Verrucomicrobiales bacterium]|nr:hypothetical protein [Verrucomicrobiales bacterium]
MVKIILDLVENASSCAGFFAWSTHCGGKGTLRHQNTVNRDTKAVQLKLDELGKGQKEFAGGKGPLRAEVGARGSLGRDEVAL